jgi:hypothetical protein
MSAISSLCVSKPEQVGALAVQRQTGYERGVLLPPEVLLAAH